MESRDHQRLLLVASFSFLILCNCGLSLDVGLSPDSEPVSAPAPEPSSNQVSFSPNTEGPSISPSSDDDYDYPLDAKPPSSEEEDDEEALAPGADPPSKDEALAPGAYPPSDALSPSPSPSAGVDPSLKRVCDITDYPDLCLTTLAPFIKGKADIMSVLKTAMTISNDLAKILSVKVNRLADDPSTDPKIATVLKGCKESFDDALANFETALGAFPAKDIATMNTMLSAVLTDIGDCEDEISNSGSPSPLSNSVDNLTNMTSNCLAILSQLNV